MSRDHRDADFLAEASTLLAASLDYEETLRRLARLAVGRLADWCVLDIVDHAGRLRRVAAAHADPAKAGLVHELLRSLDGVSVLVVDDEADTRELLRAILERCGARVATAASASEARERLARTTPGVLVSDIMMPGEDGYDLVTWLRREDARRGTRTPAIALTAYASPQDRERALRSGFDLHVPKPIEPGELVEAVAALAHA